MPDGSLITIKTANTGDLEGVANLFAAYAQSLGIDLTFQDFKKECDSLPGKYSPPKGDILVACDTGGVYLGCVAVRPIEPHGCCEMKRLYVVPDGRGRGIGRRLLDAVLYRASSLGYQELRLDTLLTMHKAIQLYEATGFERIDAYYNTPIIDTIFFARKLPI